MQTTLTLHVDEAVLEKAREYAEAATGKSLPEVLEDYLGRLAEAASEGELSPRLQRLYGALKAPEGIDDTDVLTDALLNRYRP
jgi:hypothetical protein